MPISDTTNGGFAPGLKTLEDATAIRGRILAAFEEAELTSDPQQRAALQTFVIIGGGPTGVNWPGPSPSLHETRWRVTSALLTRARPGLY